MFHFLADPAERAEGTYEYFDDGLLVLADGVVAAAGDAPALLPSLPTAATIVDYTG